MNKVKRKEKYTPARGPVELSKLGQNFVQNSSVAPEG